jgi:aspartokinase
LLQELINYYQQEETAAESTKDNNIQQQHRNKTESRRQRDNAMSEGDSLSERALATAANTERHIAAAYALKTSRTIIGRFPLKPKSTNEDAERGIARLISEQYGAETYLFTQTFYGSSFIKYSLP